MFHLKFDFSRTSLFRCSLLSVYICLQVPSGIIVSTGMAPPTTRGPCGRTTSSLRCPSSRLGMLLHGISNLRSVLTLCERGPVLDNKRKIMLRCQQQVFLFMSLILILTQYIDNHMSIVKMKPYFKRSWTRHQSNPRFGFWCCSFWQDQVPFESANFFFFFF